MPLAGTVAPHAAVILLHTHLPPASYPPRSRSLLWRALVLRGRAWGAMPNFAWAPPQSGQGHALYAGYRGLGEGGGEEGEEAYAATVFAAGRRAPVVVPEVRLGNVEEVERGVRAALATPEEDAYEGRRKVYLYVCTHGARDCRCGEGGGAVARALRAEVVRRGLGAEDVVVGEIAHVGGHKCVSAVPFAMARSLVRTMTLTTFSFLFFRSFCRVGTPRTSSCTPQATGTSVPPLALPHLPRRPRS